MQFDLNKFANEGYSGPHKLLNNKECEDLLNEKYLISKSLSWYKSIHEKSLLVLNIASNKLILKKIKSVLGKNIILWGSHFVDQKPGKEHAWHIDVEYGSWNGLTLWMGLKNLNKKTSISLMTYSHLINDTPKELSNRNNFDIKNDYKILDEAKKLNPKCEIKIFNLRPGEFIIWSGRVWHKTLNLSNKERNSIIFQYCATNNKVKIPLNYDYPNTLWSNKEPPCVIVNGKDEYKLNRIISKKEIYNFSNSFKNIKAKIFFKIRKKLALIYKNFITNF